MSVNMRQCKIPSGCKLPAHPCCADCKETCEARCLNSPKRCGCWAVVPVPQSGGGSHGRKSALDLERLLILHDQGLLQREIAQSLGCSTSSVSAALRKLGVKRYG